MAEKLVDSKPRRRKNTASDRDSSRLATLSNRDIKSEYASSVDKVITAISEASKIAAAINKRKQIRGFDYFTDWFEVLTEVASGRVRPEALLHLIDIENMRRLANTDREEQESVLNGKEFQVAHGDGRISYSLLKFNQMSRRQKAQVFGTFGARTPERQRDWIRWVSPEARNRRALREARFQNDPEARSAWEEKRAARREENRIMEFIRVNTAIRKLCSDHGIDLADPRGENVATESPK